MLLDRLSLDLVRVILEALSLARGNAKLVCLLIRSSLHYRVCDFA